MQPSRMTRAAVYAGAAAMDMVSGTLLFVVPVRAAQLGASYSMVGALGVLWAVGCAISTFGISRYITPKNSAAFCIGATIAQAVVHFCLIFTPTPVLMLPFLLLCGLTHTLFFSPYQVFIKTVDSVANLPLAHSVGIYTLAWSLGMAFGPLWSGFLMRESFLSIRGWQWCFVFTIVACLAVASMVGKIRPYLAYAPAETMEEETERPDFAKVAWFSALCGAFAFSLVRGIFPAGAVKLGVPEDIQGGVIFCMGFLQALAGYFLGRIKNWMYSPALLLAAGVLGIGGMLGFLLAFLGVLSDTWVIIGFFIGGFLFGIYSGSFYFYTVFHSLIHPSRAGFNISINEGMFAVANIGGLLLGGILSDMYGVSFPYSLAAIFIAGFTVLQIYYHAKAPWPPKVGQTFPGAMPPE